MSPWLRNAAACPAASSARALCAVAADAKAWAAQRPRDAPEPTNLHVEFIADVVAR